MWMQIEDKDGEYLINANNYKMIKESFSCHNDFQIIFFCAHGDDLILSYMSEKERDETYKKIIEFISNLQGRRPW